MVKLQGVEAARESYISISTRVRHSLGVRATLDRPITGSSFEPIVNVDAWIAADKLEHFLACLLITGLGYAFARQFTRLHRFRLFVGGIASVAFGIFKEVGDELKWWPGALSLRDLGADVAGTAAGLCLLVALESFWRPLPRRRLTFDAEEVSSYQVKGASMACEGGEDRHFHIGEHAVRLRQQPAASGSLRNGLPSHTLHAVELPDRRLPDSPTGRGGQRQEMLGNVGLVVWQSAFVLAELLLSAPPFGQWADVRAVDLGTGTGVVGIALALAGADVVLTDLPHITPLTRQNVESNCRPASHRARVLDHAWGDDTSPLNPKPDVIIGADILYEEKHFPDLLKSIQNLSAPHTVTYLAFRIRGCGESTFEEMLNSVGFAVHQIPTNQLHTEYQGGQYQVLRACRLGPGAVYCSETATELRLSSPIA